MKYHFREIYNMPIFVKLGYYFYQSINDFLDKEFVNLTFVPAIFCNKIGITQKEYLIGIKYLSAMGTICHYKHLSNDTIKMLVDINKLKILHESYEEWHLSKQINITPLELNLMVSSLLPKLKENDI